MDLIALLAIDQVLSGFALVELKHQRAIEALTFCAPVLSFPQLVLFWDIQFKVPADNYHNGHNLRGTFFFQRKRGCFEQGLSREFNKKEIMT